MSFRFGARNAVSLGPFAASTLQQSNAIAIGAHAGRHNQGAHSIAIGANAGHSNQHQSTIVMNATGIAINTLQDNSSYMAPVRFATAANLMTYNSTTKEVTYSDHLSGSLGIGTTTVSAKLHTYGDAIIADSALYKQATATVMKSNGSASLAIVAGGESYSAILYLGTPHAPNLTDGSNSAYKVAILANGNGSGTGWSTADLHFCLNDATGSGTNSYTQTASVSHSKMVIKTNGRVGIGLTNPDYKLHVSGDSFSSGNVIGSSHIVASSVVTYNNTADKGKWFKIATLPSRGVATFGVSWSVAGEHGYILLSCGQQFNSTPFIRIIEGNYYGHHIPQQFRLATDNASIYNDAYLEMYLVDTTWWSTDIQITVWIVNKPPINSSVTLFSAKTAATTTGFTYYQVYGYHPIDTNWNGARFCLANTGRVGIGTNDPGTTLDITNNSSGLTPTLNITRDTSDNNIYALAFNQGTANYNCGFGPVTSAKGTMAPTSYTMGHHVNANAEWSIISDGWNNLFSVRGGTGNTWVKGNLGIGTTTMSCTGINFPNTGAGLAWGAGFSRIVDDGHLKICTDDNMYFNMGSSTSSLGSTAIYINSSRYVGIMTTSASAPLTVNGSISIRNGSNVHEAGCIYTDVNWGMLFRGATTAAIAHFRWDKSDGGELMYLEASGRLWVKGGGDNCKTLYGPNASWSSYLSVGAGTNAISSNTAQVISTNGNLHLDAGNSKDLYLGYYANQAGTPNTIYSYGGWTHSSSLTANESYTENWFRVKQGGGLHWEWYGRGIWSPESAGNSYGNIATYGGGRNGWMGYGIGSRHCVMGNNSEVGIHDNNNSWCIYFDGSRNGTVYSTFTMSGNGRVYGTFDVGGTDNLRLESFTEYRRIQSFAGKPLAINPLGNNVGIGITNPGFPLHVSGSAGGWGWWGYWIHNRNGYGDQTIYWGVGIYATNGIVSNDFIAAVSDIRTKTNIKEYRNPLNAINELNFVSYDKIDVTEKGADVGIIAQNVKEVLPRAVIKQKGFIPNLYKQAETQSRNISGNISIFLPLSDEITEGSTIRLYIYCEEKQSEKKYEEKIIHKTSEFFEIKAWDEYSKDDKVFVYGIEVDDFLAVEKEQIGILAAAGVKELHKLVIEQESMIQEQKHLIIQLQEQNHTLSTRLARLESILFPESA